MNTRIASILAAEDLGEAGTKTIDINIKDVISRISIMFKATNVSEDMASHPAGNVTKIELVDGSDVLFSLNGHQAQAVNFYDRGIQPYSYIDNIAAHNQSAVFSLDFGRFLYDQGLAFDPTKFTNPQLKITWDEDVCEVDATVNSCSILAHIFDELVPTPTGFFMTKEVYSYTVAETGYEYIDLPTDYITQQIFIRSQLSEEVFDNILDEIKLSEDNDKRIPLDLTVNEIIRNVIEEYGYLLEHAYLNGIATTTGSFYGMPTIIGHPVSAPYGAADVSTVYTHDGGKYRYYGTSASINHKVLIYGFLPHATMPILPRPGKEIVDWWDVTKIGSLKLRIKDSAPSATTPSAQVMTKQFRTY